MNSDGDRYKHAALNFCRDSKVPNKLGFPIRMIAEPDLEASSALVDAVSKLRLGGLDKKAEARNDIDR